MNSLLPLGNPLTPADLVLSPADLKTLRGNFQSQNFSGYLTWGTRPGRRAYAFWANGEFLRCFEDRQGELWVQRWEDLILTCSEQAASYYLPAAMVRVLSAAFAMDRESKRLAAGQARELVASLESDKAHAVARFRCNGKQRAVIWENGVALQVRLATQVGEVVCAKAALTKLWEALEGGGEVECFRGQRADLDSKVERLEREMAQRTPVVPKPVSGFFASKDTAKFDADILKGWNLGGKGVPSLVVEDLEGRPIATIKATTAAGKGESLEVPAKILATWNLGASDKVLIRPLCE